MGTKVRPLKSASRPLHTPAQLLMWSLLLYICIVFCHQAVQHKCHYMYNFKRYWNLDQICNRRSRSKSEDHYCCSAQLATGMNTIQIQQHASHLLNFTGQNCPIESEFVNWNLVNMWLAVSCVTIPDTHWNSAFGSKTWFRLLSRPLRTRTSC